jgi:hypothetical protein
VFENAWAATDDAKVRCEKEETNGGGPDRESIIVRRFRGCQGSEIASKLASRFLRQAPALDPTRQQAVRAEGLARIGLKKIWNDWRENYTTKSMDLVIIMFVSGFAMSRQVDELLELTGERVR